MSTTYVEDPTNKSLEAALLDQKVAGAMGDAPYAYVAVTGANGWKIGIAVANERGYSPVPGGPEWPYGPSAQADAQRFVDGMNKHIGLPPDHAVEIEISTMGGRAYRMPA